MNNFRYAKNKIESSILKNKPFPYFAVKNLIPHKELNQLNKILPSFNEIEDQDIYHQVKSDTKKVLLPNSKIYKKLIKKTSFKKLNSLFEKLKPFILKKFDEPIKNYVNKKYQKSRLTFHSVFSLMKKGYYLKPHIDRREHLITILFYPSSQALKGGDIKLMQLKKNPNKINNFDVFPKTNSLKLGKSFKIKNNFCLITLNVPWSYHSVSKYSGKKDRKYFYFVYDFPTKDVGAKLKNRKKGNNQNTFWKSKVSVFSQKRRKEFFQAKS